MLRDAKHKEQKSGVQLGPGNTLTIQQGVGTPTTINVLSFGKDGTLLAAGKDFGRVVVWDVVNRKFLCAIETGQGIVRAVAILLLFRQMGKPSPLLEKVTNPVLSFGICPMGD